MPDLTLVRATTIEIIPFVSLKGIRIRDIIYIEDIKARGGISVEGGKYCLVKIINHEHW